MRRWYFAPRRVPASVIVTPQLVQIMAGVARQLRDEHPRRPRVPHGRRGAAARRRRAALVRRDDRLLGQGALITWTSNIQGWMVHGSFEYSSKMQTIEIYTPNRDARGKFIGLNHEAIFYDPEALVEPIRIVRNLPKHGGFEEGDPYVFIDCIPTIFPVKGSRRR